MNVMSLQDINQLESRQRANIINSLSGYKSPLLLGSGVQGHENLAIFSNVFHIGSHPPLIGIFFRPDGENIQRDSLKNILNYKKFSLNYISEEIIKKAHQTSARYPENQSEFEQTQLSTLYMEEFEAPLVKESNLSLALELEEHIPVKTNKTSIVIGRIISIYSQTPLITNNILELEKFSDIAVKGLDTYYQVQKLTRLSYAKPDKEPENV